MLNIGSCLSYKGYAGYTFVVSEVFKSKVNINIDNEDIGNLINYVLININGSSSITISHSDIFRCNWAILEHTLSKKEINHLKIFISTNEKNIEEEKRKVIDEIINFPEYNGLYIYDNSETESKSVAKNIRKLLKRHFHGVKFSVRMDGTKSVNVNWVDGPTEEDVEAIIGRFKKGYFKSMPGVYECNDDPFNIAFGGVDYLSVNRDFSDELIKEAINVLSRKYGDDIIVSEKTLEEYKTGNLWMVHHDKFKCGLKGELNRIMNSLDKYSAK